MLTKFNKLDFFYNKHEHDFFFFLHKIAEEIGLWPTKISNTDIKKQQVYCCKATCRHVMSIVT